MPVPTVQSLDPARPRHVPMSVHPPISVSLHPHESEKIFIYDAMSVVLAMILPIEALRNALVGAFNQITSNLNAIP